MERIVIIDCNSLMYRAFYGLPPLTNSEGLTTNAIYGMATMLYKIKEEFDPKYIAATFDRKAPTFRHLEYKEYKAGRKKMPPELAEQIPYIKELIENFGAARFEIDGFEADDLIGTIAKRAQREGKEVFVVTGDKDALQLADENINIVINKKGMTNIEVYNRNRIIEDIGVTPEEFIDVKGLMGDKSDNIPGVPGIGEKTAIKLIKQYGSIENLLNNIHELKGKMKEKLQENAELAVFSKRLATINTEVPIEFEIEDMNQENRYKASELLEMFYKFQFKSLIPKIATSGEEKQEENTVEESLVKADSTEVDTIEGLRDAFDGIVKEEEVFVLYDIKDSHTFTELYLSKLHVRIGEKIYDINIEKIMEENATESVEELKRLFNSDNRIIGHDVKHLYMALKKLEIDDFIVSFDTEIAAYLMDPGKKSYLAETLVEGYVHKGVDQEDKNNSILMNLPEVYKILEEKIAELHSEKLMYEIEMPLTKVIADMEFEGFTINKEILESLGEKFKKEIKETEDVIYELCDEKFNIKSPKQLGKILFEKMDLPVIKKTKTGYSTNAEVLEKLLDKHPVIEKIIYYRQITKLNSTYVEGLNNVIDSDGKIHTSFTQTLTTTGRLSSTEPNLQNIPVKTEMGREIRKVFVPEQGCMLISADYSQIELRVLAHISGDEILIDSFTSEEDIHRRTASEVFGVPMEEVTSTMRSNAKAVNFGIIYGIGDFSLAKDLGITKKEAKEYIEAYLSRYPKVKEYLDNVVQKAKEDGEVRTMLNRRRFIPELASAKKMMQAFGIRLAMNTPIQGSAADIMKIAMVNVWDEIRNRGLKSRVILQVHDEIIINVVEGEEQVVTEILQDQMKDRVENQIEFKVPLSIDVNDGKSWYDVK